jgi:dihydroneopterin aldolase/2-amino-4-hydroxy-6-hydroxymethyldihydropteridine diphosphokinase
MDCIAIKKLEIFAKHGVFAEEKALGQKFIISAKLYTDVRKAGKSDDLADSLDYGGACVDIINYVQNNTFNLIERVAEGLTEMLFKKNPKLQKVEIEVEKPWAPIGANLETVSVKIERSRHRVIIALGSNIGNREEHLRFGIDELSRAENCEVLRVSSLINTMPYGVVEQDDFLNGCLELETLLEPLELLDLTKSIEKMCGRAESKRWGPRTLDLDIIFFDDLIFSSDRLRIPHIDAHRRDFVLIPMDEIVPNYFHPILMKTVRELLEDLHLGN